MTSVRKVTQGVRWFDSVLLCVVLGLIVLRATVIETPLVDQLQTRLFLSSEVVSLFISTALLVCIGLWLLRSVITNRFYWRPTGFGFAVAVFILAGILSTFFASDKRAAVTDLATLAIPMLAGLLLVQLLTSQIKIRLALLLIVSVGIAATILCIDQQMDSNQTLIDDYEANQSEHLQKQGIEPDGMEHWMYEHRLYSRDIRGFSMTSNSAGTFFLMAIFSGLGLCLQAISKKMSQETMAALACYILALSIVVFGLFLTQSKGGIGAFAAGLIILSLLLCFKRMIWGCRRSIGITVLLIIVIGAAAVIFYGVQHGRLPGGNSMLVRWQYWQSSVEMVWDHIVTGVGGGNFPKIYTHYKIPAALETVQNPHNWILSVLSQYGPLGLTAFMAAIMLPLYRAFCLSYDNTTSKIDEAKPKRSQIWIGLLVSVSSVLLMVRPLMVDAEFLYQRADVRSAAYLVLYLFPAGVVLLSFILLRVASIGDASVDGRNDRLTFALICGVVAVLIHNLIDFAIFEPGNWSVLWLLIAVVTALSHNRANIQNKVVLLDIPKRFGVFAGLILFVIVFLAVVLIPPVQADHYFKRAMFDDMRRIELIDRAIASDRLSSKAAYKSASMFYQSYQQPQVQGERFLQTALGLAEIAAIRNPGDFKPLRLMGQVEVLLAEATDEKQAHLEWALGYFKQAIDRYPGSGRLHYNLANVAEQLDRKEEALAHYRMAVEIEDAYREQFQIMYPERETVISRVGNETYEKAKSKLPPN
jgi:hypothetical protein